MDNHSSDSFHSHKNVLFALSPRFSHHNLTQSAHLFSLLLGILENAKKDHCHVLSSLGFLDQAPNVGLLEKRVKALPNVHEIRFQLHNLTC